MGGNLFINYLQTDPRFFFAVVITIVISITLHELAHGWAAIKVGDETPNFTGHMTMNPLVHMGGYSIVMLLVAGIAWGAMPIDPTRMKGKYAESLVAIAGPATNIILAVLAIVALGLWDRFDTSYAPMSHAAENGRYLLMIFGRTNLMLAIFNMIPVPPLDGGHVLANFVPAYRKWLSQPSAQGIMSVLFFVLFFNAGGYIFDAADHVTLAILSLVSGQHYF